jgi:hypothetical protein
MRLKTFVLFAFVVMIGACKKWDDHVPVTNQDLTQNLLQAISANPDLSKFREYLGKTGLDSLLQSSKTFTVWAPGNAALQSLDPALVADVAKLKAYLGNHIAYQSYFTRNAQTTVRVPMLNGKYNSFSVNKFEDAGITTADKYVSNGVLHIIDKGIAPLPNIWDYINSTGSQYIQNGYIAGLNFNSFDPALATIDSISSLTGLPVYHVGTGIVQRNRFNDRVYDLRREDKQYTYFVIANPGFTLESDSLKNYYKTTSTTSTDSLAKWNTVKDLVIEGYYPANALPPVVISKYGVPVPINQGSIISSQKLSNGIVYVLSNINVLTASKFPVLTIQGESPSGFLSDKTSNTNYRVRFNPSTGQNFIDILVSGHGVTGYYSYYRLNEVPSIKYKVYGFAVNDFQTGAVTESIVFKSFVPPATYTTITTLNYPVPLSTAAGAYNEVLLGEVTFTGYGTVEVQLTSSGTNPIVLDYLRLVPVP